MRCAAGMRTLLINVLTPWLVTVAFWVAFGACIDETSREAPPVARIVATWDPLACGPPHRVVLELEDEGGAKLATSMPCNAGGLALDARHFGIYRGRVYATELDPHRVELWVEQEIYAWWMGSPP